MPSAGIWTQTHPQSCRGYCIISGTVLRRIRKILQLMRHQLRVIRIRNDDRGNTLCAAKSMERCGDQHCFLN